MNTQLLTTLKDSKLLKNIDTESLEFSGVNGDLLTVKEGEIIYRSNEDVQNMFLIVSGEVNLIMRDKSHEIKSVMKGVGDFCGDENIFDLGIAESTAVALSDCYLVVLSKSEVEYLTNQQPAILGNINPELAPEDSESTPSVDADLPKEEIEEKEEPDSTYADEGIIPADDKNADAEIPMADSANEDEPESTEGEESEEEAIENLLDEPIDEGKSSEDSAEDELTAAAESLEAEPFNKEELIQESPQTALHEEEPEESGIQADSAIEEVTEESETAVHDNNNEIPEPVEADSDLAASVEFAEQLQFIEQEQKRLTERSKQLDKAIFSVYSEAGLGGAIKSVVESANTIVPCQRVEMQMIGKSENQDWRNVSGLDSGTLFLELVTDFAKEVFDLAKVLRINNQIPERYQTGEEIYSLLGIPLRNTESEITGVLILINAQTGEFTEEDESLLLMFSRHAYQAVELAERNSAENKKSGYNSIEKLGYFLRDELRKPLYNSKTYIENVRKDPNSGNASEYLNMSADYLKDAHDVLARILAFSGDENKLHLIRKNVNELLNDYTNKMSTSLNQLGAEIIFESGGEFDVKVDFDEFYYCFRAIVKNSCEAAFENTQIRISTVRENGTVRIRFDDSGIGIMPDKQERVFEPFYSEGKESASGLGLTLARKIVEAHSGSIKIESSGEGGTSVIVSLPVAAN